jgi:hypothetical protein
MDHRTRSAGGALMQNQGAFLKRPPPNVRRCCSGRVYAPQLSPVFSLRVGPRIFAQEAIGSVKVLAGFLVPVHPETKPCHCWGAPHRRHPREDGGGPFR